MIKIKTQKGFIKISLLAAIIVGILVIGSVGYVGIKQYLSSQDKKRTETEQLLKQTNATIETDKKRGAELEALKKEVEDLKQQTIKANTIDNLTKEVKNLKQETKTNQINNQKTQNVSTVSQEITSTEIQPYLNTIGVLTCWDTDFNRQYGTGVLLSNGKLMTNWHVVKGMDTCLFVNDKFMNPKYEVTAMTYRPGAYILDLSNIQRPNINLDFAIIPFTRNESVKCTLCLDSIIGCIRCTF